MAQTNLNLAHDQTPHSSGLAVAFSHFEIADQISRIRGEKSWQESPGRVTRMLAKAPGLRVVLILMRAGNRWEEHKTDSRISIQPIEGSVRFFLTDRTVELRTGELLVLEPGIPHGVEALEEAAFLLTLS